MSRYLPRPRPGLPFLRRARDRVQIGLDPRTAVVVDRLTDDAGQRAAAPRRQPHHRRPRRRAPRARRVSSSSCTSAASSPTTPGRRALVAAHKQQRYADDLAALSHAHGSDGALRVLARRGRSTVVVRGDDRRRRADRGRAGRRRSRHRRRRGRGPQRRRDRPHPVRSARGRPLVARAGRRLRASAGSTADVRLRAGHPALSGRRLLLSGRRSPVDRSRARRRPARGRRAAPRGRRRGLDGARWSVRAAGFVGMPLVPRPPSSRRRSRLAGARRPAEAASPEIPCVPGDRSHCRCRCRRRTGAPGGRSGRPPHAPPPSTPRSS